MGEKIHSVAEEFVKEMDYDRKFFSHYNNSLGLLIVELGYESGDDAGNVVRAVHKLSEAVGCDPYFRYTKDLTPHGMGTFLTYKWDMNGKEGEFKTLEEKAIEGYISGLVKL